MNAAKRIGLLLFGTFLGLFLAELGLRLAAPFWSEIRGGSQGRTTILCVGDSHTYGLHVPAGFDYPSRLQAELDPTTTEIGVINRGVPGRNSAALLAELPRYLEETAPDIVLLLVGFNDAWNFDATSKKRSAGPLAHLRILKLFRLLRMNLAGREPEDGAPRIVHRDGRMVVIEDGSERAAAVGGSAFEILHGDALADRVGVGLEAMIELCREHGATPVVLTYATENQPSFLQLNQNARDLATENKALLIETAQPFREAIAERGYERLFFPDDHPNTAGNELFARMVADALCEAGLARRIRTDGPIAADPPPTLRVEADQTGVRFEILAEPRRAIQVILSGSLGPPFTFQETEIPLGAHPLIRRCLESTNLRGRTDAAGRCTLSLPASFLSDESQETVHAVALCFPPGAPPSVSPPIAFTPAR